MTNFADLGLSGSLLKALAAQNYRIPTPIQARAIPALLARRDLLGIAQTGTGKTAAFTLPILDVLSSGGTRPQARTCRALILAPTRELCAQISDAVREYGQFSGLGVATIYGGVSIGPQIRAVQQGVDIVVATPGRLVDLINRGALSLSHVSILVLDEADQMLDLGFIHAIRKITGYLPKTRQSMFFSATMPKAIAALARELLTDPMRIEVTPAASTVEGVSQQVIHLAAASKLPVLIELLKKDSTMRAIIFTRTKRGADKLTRGLNAAELKAMAIHGNKSQSHRERVLARFRSGHTNVLVATDIAARGIDVEGISHIINYDLPHVAEAYVHRIGRTARAGASGVAISFCEPEQLPLLRSIELTTRTKITILRHHLADRPQGSATRQDRRPSNGRVKHRAPRSFNKRRATSFRSASPLLVT